jgi:hypothetical protein
MINYSIITLKDKELFDRYFSTMIYRNCDFSFANLFCWQNQYRTTFALVEEFLVIRYICDDGLPCFMMPVGKGDMSKVLLRLLDECREEGIHFRIHAITLEMFDLLNIALPDTFKFTPMRDYFEYIYSSEDLIYLKGKRFQPKRNHINKFISLFPDYKYLKVTKELIPSCKQLYEKWRQEYELKHEDSNLDGEGMSVYSALDNFDSLELMGGALMLDNELIAFSVGQSVTSDTFIVYIEKALTQYPGVYQLINQQFIAHEASEFPYINREEDLGILSLRQAKMSYYPIRFLERGSVCLKEKPCL